MFGFITRRYHLATEIQVRGRGPRKQLEECRCVRCEEETVLVPSRTRMVRAVVHAGHYGQDTIALRHLTQWLLTFVGLGPFGYHTEAFLISWAYVVAYPVAAFLRESADAAFNTKTKPDYKRWFSKWDVYDGALGGLATVPPALALTLWSFDAWWAALAVGLASVVAGLVLAVGVWFLLLEWEARSDG